MAVVLVVRTVSVVMIVGVNGGGEVVTMAVVAIEVEMAAGVDVEV